MGRLSLRSKVVLILSPLIILTVAISVVLLMGYATKVDNAHRVVNSGQSFSFLSRFIHEFQKERGMSVLYLNGVIKKDAYLKQQENSNSVLNKFKESLRKTSVNANEDMNDFFSNINSTRALALEMGDASKVINAYSETIQLAIISQRPLFRNAQYEGLESRILTLSIFEIAKENMGQLRATLNSYFSKDKAISLDFVFKTESLLSGILSSLNSPGLVISDKAKNKVLSILQSPGWNEIRSNYDILKEKYLEGTYGVDAGKFSSNITKIIDDVFLVLDEELENAINTAQEAQDNARKSVYLLVFVLLSVLVMAFLFTFFVMKKIILSLTEVATSLDLSGNKVRDTAVVIASSAEQLSSATNQQVAAFQQTSAAVDEINSMAMSTAENSSQGQTLTHDGMVASSEGAKIVEEMLHSMNDINECNNLVENQVKDFSSSMKEILNVIQEIGDKTKVINDIVFQTKLLSFNASVEAARAGEQGRGFAVVAEEVGGLAQMSGNAAEEIAKVLSEGIQKVESTVKSSDDKIEQLMKVNREKINAGQSVANECNAIFSRINELMTKISSLVDSIALAGKEQAGGVFEIQKAISESNGAALQNSQLALNSTQAADELRKQTEIMADVIRTLLVNIKGES